MKNPRYSTANGTALSLSNLYFRNECSVEAIRDAVEDAHTATELMENINALNLFEKFTIDRVTDSYVRLKSKDCFGNIHYFKADIDKTQTHKLADYYDAMADNYIIPIEEMTDELMNEALALLKKSPWNNEPHTYMMFIWNDGEGDNWCITSWVE